MSDSSSDKMFWGVAVKASRFTDNFRRPVNIYLFRAPRPEMLAVATGQAIAGRGGEKAGYEIFWKRENCSRATARIAETVRLIEIAIVAMELKRLSPEDVQDKLDQYYICSTRGIAEASFYLADEFWPDCAVDMMNMIDRLGSSAERVRDLEQETNRMADMAAARESSHRAEISQLREQISALKSALATRRNTWRIGYGSDPANRAAA